jgi:hypothetical protein
MKPKIQRKMPVARPLPRNRNDFVEPAGGKIAAVTMLVVVVVVVMMMTITAVVVVGGGSS